MRHNNANNFSVYNNQDNIQDLFDVEDYIDDLVGNLLVCKGVTKETWQTIENLVYSIDSIKHRNIIFGCNLQTLNDFEKVVDTVDGD